MNVHVSYKIHKTPDIEKELSHQIEKIQKRLRVFPSGPGPFEGPYRTERGARGNADLDESESAFAFRATGRSSESSQRNRGHQGGL